MPLHRREDPAGHEPRPDAARHQDGRGQHPGRPVAVRLGRFGHAGRGPARRDQDHPPRRPEGLQRPLRALLAADDRRLRRLSRVPMRAVAALLGFTAAGLCACAPFGLIYTHTVEPLSTDFHVTPVVDQTAAGDVKEIQYYVRVLWSENGIGAVAKKHGFDKVYYADHETLSVFGIWVQEWAHIYGTRKVATADAGAPAPASGGAPSEPAAAGP